MLELKAETEKTLRTPEWYKTATRWTQLTLAEDDPVKFDPAFWIDVFRRTQSNATCLSAGGYIAYYPSEVPLHYVSRFVGETDPFGTLVNGARSLGMHVMARVDPHAIHQDAADAHPEWIAVDVNGKPRRHWAFPDVWVTCAYGDYNTGFMPKVVEEITRRYDIDAIFANRWQGHGVCYCADCTKRFKAATGFDLPRDDSLDNPAWHAWVDWRRDVLTQVIVQWDEVVKAVKPHASFIPNMGHASLMEFDLKIIEKHCPFLVVDHQGRRGVEVGWSAGRAGKRMRAGFPERPVVLITSVGLEDVNRWKDSVQTGPELELWIDDGTAQGMSAWFTKFNGVVPDNRWVQPIADSFGRHADVEPALNASRPTAEIAVIDPATTLRHVSPDRHATAEAHELGFYQALVEARLPFEMVSDQMLKPEMLDRFKVLVLPNAVCLSDGQCQAIREYVARGGSIVAAHETSLADERGKRRQELGLADVFGVHLTAATRGPVKNTYVALNGSHPVSAGYEGANRIIGGTHLLTVEPAKGAETPFLYVPDFPDLPMEEVYPRLEPAGAAVVARDTGHGGRAVYIPWNIGEVFWTVLAEDHGRLIGNAVRWALGTRQAVEVSGDGIVDIGLRESEEGLVVSLVNLTNPMMMKGPLRKAMPIGQQVISAALPEAKTGATARLLLAGEAAEVKVVGGRAEIIVPGLTSMEVVEVRWA